MGRLLSLFMLKITLTSLLINIVLPVTFIINDRVFGFEKTGSNQISFLTLSIAFNLIIVPAYSLILVSQNLNWLIMMPISRIRLVLASSLLRLWSFGIGLGLLVATQVLMEKLYYENLGHYETSTLKQLWQNAMGLSWVDEIDWSYSTYALMFSLLCLFLSGFVMNFDLESKHYRFTFKPFLFLLKGKFKAIVGLALLILFFGFMSLSRANLFIIFSMILPFFMYLTANVFVLERGVFRFIKIIAAGIMLVHVVFILLAREELKHPEVSLERSIRNYEYLEIYTANPKTMAQKILNKMLEVKVIDTNFIRNYFDELDTDLLARLLQFHLDVEDLERFYKFVPRTRLDPFFYDPGEALESKTSVEASLKLLEFYSIKSLSLEQTIQLLTDLSKKFPSSLDRFFHVLSKRHFDQQEILTLLQHEDKYVVKLAVVLLRYYPQYELQLQTLRDIMEEYPLLIEEVYKTIIVRTGEFIDVSRIPLLLSSHDLNRQESCPDTASELFRLVGDKGSYRTYTLCVRTYLNGQIQPVLEQMEVIENPFYGNHLSMVRALFR